MTSQNIKERKWKARFLKDIPIEYPKVSTDNMWSLIGKGMPDDKDKKDEKKEQ